MTASTPATPSTPSTRPAEALRGIAAATRALDPPFAVVDVAAWRANAADLVRRAGGLPIRVASKSVRSRALLRDVLGRPGFAGVLAYTLPEALWLAADPDPVSTDVVVGYPTADRAALRALTADPVLAARVTLMVDDVAQLDLVDAARAPGGADVRVCLELDASLRLLGGRVHLGVRRSPLHRPRDVVALAREVVARPGFRPVGLMAYEAQVAGLQDAAAGTAAVRRRAVRAVQAASMAQLRRRRPATVAALREVFRPEFVNGGGSGSVQRTALDRAVTEIAAGSGLLVPTLFDGYSTFTPRPAAYFALPVVRRPGPGLVTVLGGGWIASGPAGPDRVPVPVHPAGLRLLPTEGAGEVQTPLAGPAADGLRIGDRVWFRHAKAGELAEHVDVYHLVDGDRIVGTAPTYRGEGRAFL